MKDKQQILDPLKQALYKALEDLIHFTLHLSRRFNASG